ncbi:nickel pincer cofactor biosynthesis protein LarB [Halorubellus litoreus]|uniref:Nickel pincer cofactor biosynthesis protein LarB n=1 Tax=Halorubellus litoreus TaxID=755308 RepID=A0ABD5VA54_9EURY
MRDVLERVADGDLSPAAAEAELRGYATTDDGRFDAAREQRRGVPEAVLADEKTPEEVATLAAAAVETTGRALVTRASDAAATAVRERLAADHPEADVTVHDRSGFVVAHAPGFDAPDVPATVAVVSGGTGDAAAAEEAAVVAREMGATVDTVHDVGVASIARVLDARETLDDADALVVAAGREGALPTVVAGLVSAPVVGLPVSTGYGHGGEGEAALSGMLQSCTVLSVVNVDAGFVAGAQAALVARRVGAARDGNT